MNRKKKIYETLKKKDKRANAKLHKSNKPRYISKAEREKIAAQQNSEELNSENNEH
ncbi:MULTISPECIES: DUF2986 domain-containing protein [Pseudoalteromonas]|uniref:DUF2986 domain-containing protein n=1 Tax=Pseudoalteromonas TaxID=53246 RepID=UPI00083E0B39|nr:MULTISPECIES: DUF2986 domain-containing protein [Pseudoalteromonas]MCG7539253.1 DUF2986 domain-containing protein [Pseudoalteromonas sp. OF7H-1]ODB41970.1 DUF2986 domain-containing protein [Pseudoalteromonas sp. BMB]